MSGRHHVITPVNEPWAGAPQWIKLGRLMPISICLVSAFLCARPAAAGQNILGVTPMVVEADVQPGTTYTSTIRVHNEAGPGANSPTASPTRVKVRAMDWTMTLDGTPQFVAAGTLPGSCSKWTEVNPAEFDLQPGQTQEVRCTLTVPSNARGTYHTVFMVETGTQPQKTRSGGMTVIGRIGSILYVTAGPHRKSGRIVDFQASAAGMSLTLENDGDDHLRLTGGVTVKDSASRVIRDEKLPGAVILPRYDKRRKIILNWPTRLPPGEYSVTAIIDYGGEELLGAEIQIKVP